MGASRRQPRSRSSFGLVVSFTSVLRLRVKGLFGREGGWAQVYAAPAFPYGACFAHTPSRRMTTMRSIILAAVLALGTLGFVSATAEAGPRWGGSYGGHHRGGYYGGQPYRGYYNRGG